MEVTEGKQGSNLTAKTGFIDALFLFALLNSILLGIALAISIAESINPSGYSLDGFKFVQYLISVFCGVTYSYNF